MKIIKQIKSYVQIQWLEMRLWRFFVEKERYDKYIINAMSFLSCATISILMIIASLIVNSSDNLLLVFLVEVSLRTLGGILLLIASLILPFSWIKTPNFQHQVDRWKKLTTRLINKIEKMTCCFYIHPDQKEKLSQEIIEKKIAYERMALNNSLVVVPIIHTRTVSIKQKK